MRRCLAPVRSEISQAATEAAAKRMALESWTAKTAAFGAGFTRWQLAVQRILVCKPLTAPGTRGFACVASGTPCTIQQNPSGPLPPGAQPTPPVPRDTPAIPRRRFVPGRNIPFEV